MKSWKAVSAALLSVSLIAAGVSTGAAVANSAPKALSNATLAWSINDEVGGGAYFGGCNFLSAGVAGDTGSSRVWTESDGFYKSAVGNVRIEKPNATGNWVAPTWGTKCQNKDGGSVTPAPGSTTGNRVVLSKGAGSVDSAAGTAQVNWQGSFTVVFYGGLTYWSASNPKLTINADGTGQLSATASGYGASMEDPNKWEKLPNRDIVLADLESVSISDDGLVTTPKYLGIEVELSSGTEQVKSGPSWGSFPQSFVDYQILTGQSSYWYSSGGAPDPKKVTTTDGLSVIFDDETDPVVPAVPSRITASAAAKRYGSASTVAIAVTAAGQAVSGNVVLKRGSTTIGTAAVANGRASITIGATALPVGTQQLTAQYLGSAKVLASSTAVRVNVAKASAKISAAKATKKKIKRNKKSAVKVTVKVAGTNANGRVRVTWRGTKGKAKGTTITQTKKLNKKGKATIKSKKLKKRGTYKVQVNYIGSATTTTAKKAGGKVNVR